MRVRIRPGDPVTVHWLWGLHQLSGAGVLKEITDNFYIVTLTEAVAGPPDDPVRGCGHRGWAVGDEIGVPHHGKCQHPHPRIEPIIAREQPPNA